MDCAGGPDTLDAGVVDAGVLIPRSRTICVETVGGSDMQVRLDASVGRADVFAEPPCPEPTTALVATVAAGEVASLQQVEACTWAIIVYGEGGVVSDWRLEVNGG